MKTREQILAEIVHKHFENVPAQFKQDFHKGFGEIWNVALLAMKESAEQALDLAAEKATFKEIPFDTKLYDHPEWDLDNDGRFYQIDKHSILSLKDQLK